MSLIIGPNLESDMAQRNSKAKPALAEGERLTTPENFYL